MQPERNYTQPRGRCSFCARHSRLPVIALILMAVLCCAGCATTKRSQREELKREAGLNTMRQTVATTLLKDDIEDNAVRVLTERLNRILESRRTREEGTERVTETFDCTQPVDSLTGTPPLKSRVTEKNNSRESADTRNREESVSMGCEAEETNRKVQKAEGSDSMEREEHHSHEEVTSDERRDQSASHSLLLTLGGVMISAFFLWLLLTVGKAVRNLFKK